jgi:hypothetical protein
MARRSGLSGVVDQTARAQRSAALMTVAVRRCSAGMRQTTGLHLRGRGEELDVLPSRPAGGVGQQYTPVVRTA